MPDKNWTWHDARSIEQNLDAKIENALVESGLSTEAVRTIMESRENMPETLRPVTERQIESQREQVARAAREQGLNIRGINDQ